MMPYEGRFLVFIETMLYITRENAIILCVSGAIFMNAVPRLNRLLAADGKCFDVAIDHGFFNERLVFEWH